MTSHLSLVLCVYATRADIGARHIQRRHTHIMGSGHSRSADDVIIDRENPRRLKKSRKQGGL